MTMRLRIALILIGWIFLGIFAVEGQVPMTGAGKGTPTAAGYQGPGDLVAYSTWSGLQAYSAATRGQPAANVCDTATGLVCADFSTDATTGKLVLGTIGGSSCTIISCSIKKLYDQTGNSQCGAPCDLGIGGAAVAAWPTLNTTGVGGNPTMGCSGAASQGMASSPITNGGSPQPISVSAVAKSTNTGAQQALLLVGSNTIELGYRNSADNQIFLYGGGTLTATASDGAFHALQAVWNGASSDANVDGVAGVGNAGADVVAAGTQIVVCIGAGQVMTGEVGEVGVLYNGAAFSGATSSALSVLAHSRWGF